MGVPRGRFAYGVWSGFASELWRSSWGASVPRQRPFLKGECPTPADSWRSEWGAGEYQK